MPQDHMFRIFETKGHRATSGARADRAVRHRQAVSSRRRLRSRSISERSASLLQLFSRFFHLPIEHSVTTRFANDSLIEEMAERVRAVIARQPGHRIDVVAQTLRLSPVGLEHLMANPDDAIDVTFLLDAVAALVHEAGMDPKWLLTGQYDPAMHRKALLLGEDRSADGARVMREFVEEEYRRLRTAAMLHGGSYGLGMLEG